MRRAVIQGSLVGSKRLQFDRTFALLVFAYGEIRLVQMGDGTNHVVFYGIFFDVHAFCNFVVGQVFGKSQFERLATSSRKFVHAVLDQLTQDFRIDGTLCLDTLSKKGSVEKITTPAKHRFRYRKK